MATYDAMKSLTTGTKSATEATVELAAGFGTAITAGALAGSQFGTLGTIIGGVAGLTTSAVTAIMGYCDGIQELGIPTTNLTDSIKSLNSELENNRNKFEQTVQSITADKESKIINAEYSKKLVDQLDDLVDANGRVKDGQEERVKYILGEMNNALGTEYELNGKNITQNGKVVKSYSSLRDEISKTIQTLKDEAEAQALQEMYKASIKESIQLQLDKQKATQKAKEAEQEYLNLMSKGYGQWTLEHNEDCKQIIQNYTDTRNALSELSDKTVENSAKTRDLYAQLITKTGEFADSTKQASDEVAETNAQMAESAQQTAEQVQVSLNTLSASMLESGEVTQEQFATMIAEGGQQLQDMVKNNVDKWNELYDSANTAQQASMLAQSTTLQTWSPQLQAKWAEMAKNSATDFKNNIDSVDVDTRSKILSAITNTQTLSPEMIESWRKMSADSNSQYNMALQSVDEDTRMILQASINGVENLSPVEIQKWADVAKNSKDRYNQALSGVDQNTSAKIQSCVDAINNKGWSAEEAGRGLALAVEKGTNTIDTSEAGRQAVNGVTKGINQNSNSQSLWSAIGGVVSNVKNAFKRMLGIASPSKVMAELASYIPSGVAKGIKDNISETTKPIKELTNNISSTFSDNVNIPNISKELTEGIKVNTKDFSVDANQYIDYGSINGKIQSTVSVNSGIADKIAQASYRAFIRAMQDEGVRLDIRADEGVIVEKASQGFKDYVTQTGELPFPVPAG